MCDNVWSLIAEHVPAHPQTYTRLAQVNLNFFQIFMADSLWQKLDFYNVEENISQHYLLLSSRFSKDDRMAVNDFFRYKAKLERNVSPPCTCGREQSSCDICAFLYLCPGALFKDDDIMIMDFAKWYVVYMVIANNIVFLKYDLVLSNDSVQQLLHAEIGLLLQAGTRSCREAMRAVTPVNTRATFYSCKRARADKKTCRLAVRDNSMLYEIMEQKPRNQPDVYTAYIKGLRKGLDRLDL